MQSETRETQAASIAKMEAAGRTAAEERAAEVEWAAVAEHAAIKRVTVRAGGAQSKP